MNKIYSAIQRTPSRARRGLSLLEFIGCLIAVVGGVWLGALYLGVNVDRLAYTAMEEANVLDNVPDRFRPVPPPIAEAAMPPEELHEKLRAEMEALRIEISALRESASGEQNVSRHEEPPPEPSDSDKTSLEPTRRDTVAYWQRLGEIAHDEAALQVEASSALSESSADHVFALKARVCRFAAKAVRALPTERVDADVLQFGVQLADWYKRGSEMNDQAAAIWSRPDGARAIPKLQSDWQVTERQHQNEARFLFQKAEAVRAEASRRFGTGFPGFANSAAAGQ